MRVRSREADSRFISNIGSPPAIGWLLVSYSFVPCSDIVFGSWGQPSKLKFQALRLIFETARFDNGSIILNRGIKYFEPTR